MKRYISAIIFWGALWGIEEATLGHLLHITSLNIGWFIWFPLAYFFMGMVYRQTGKTSSIVFTSFIAATIKFVNLFMTVNVLIIICPAISILLEGISMFGILILFGRIRVSFPFKLLETASVSILWRTLYPLCILTIPTSIMTTYPYNSLKLLLKFTLFEGIGNFLFIFAMIAILKKVNRIFKTYKIKTAVSKICFKPLVSLCLLAAALIVQRIL